METNTESHKMKRQRNMFQINGQNKNPEKELNEIDISSVPDKEHDKNAHKIQEKKGSTQ